MYHIDLGRRRRSTGVALRLSVAVSLLIGSRGTNVWGQVPGNGHGSLDTVMVMVGGGVRGRIDTLKVQVKGGPSHQEFFRIVRAKGYRASAIHSY